MKTLVHVTAQYYENYNTSGVGEPYWKPKGGQVFSLMVDSDLFLYGKRECVKSIERLLGEVSNDYCRFEYIDHELVFGGIEPLDSDKFAEYVKDECKKSFYS
jgi:hypothetical protein